MVKLIDKLPLRVVLTVSLVIIITVTGGLASYLAYRNGQHAVNELASQLHGEITARIQQHFDPVTWNVPQLRLTVVLIAPALLITSVPYLLRRTRYAEPIVYLNLTVLA